MIPELQGTYAVPVAALGFNFIRFGTIDGWTLERFSGAPNPETITPDKSDEPEPSPGYGKQQAVQPAHIQTRGGPGAPRRACALDSGAGG